MDNTFVAIATPQIYSAIAIVRINGDSAYKILAKITNNKIIKKGYSVQKCFLYDEDKIIDECILVKFVSPRSFTGDDLIEINCHGGPIIIDKIVKLLLKNGARLAENGEFTKRAFINNKLSLMQANAINNLIFAKTERSYELSINSLVNNNKHNLEKIKEKMFSIIGKIEVNIDYPEYDDVEVINHCLLKKYLLEIIDELKKAISNFKTVNSIYNGINIAIIGKPNVGKSSLLNALLKKDKAIVSNIEGTTRDVVNDSVVINDILFNFIDTAGIRKTQNKVEVLGIKKSFQLIKEADFIIFVIDKSKVIDQNEIKIMSKLKNKPHILVKNKADLKVDKNPQIKGLNISTKNYQLDELILHLTNTFKTDLSFLKKNSFITSKEEELEINNILQLLLSSLDDANKNIPLDVIVENIIFCYKKICVLLGEIEDLDLINKLFKNFCLGK